jgi:plasmid stabilization system protein ParE
MRAATDNIRDVLANEGVDATLHPRVLGAFNRLDEASNGNVTLKGAEILRRVMNAAAKSPEADERRLAVMMRDHYDDYVGNLQPHDLIAGNAPEATQALGDARNLWSRARKGETIEDLLDNASLRAGNLENAIRTEFRGLARDPKRMRLFNDDEQDSIRRIVEGGSLGNIMRWAGRWAPNGVVSAALGAVPGFLMGGAAGGAAGAAAAGSVGTAARSIATAMTQKNVQRASELMRRGQVPQPSLWDFIGRNAGQLQGPATAFGANILRGTQGQ